MTRLKERMRSALAVVSMACLMAMSTPVLTNESTELVHAAKQQIEISEENGTVYSGINNVVNTSLKGFAANRIIKENPPLSGITDVMTTVMNEGRIMASVNIQNKEKELVAASYEEPVEEIVEEEPFNPVCDIYDVSKISGLTQDQMHLLTDDTWWEGAEDILYTLETTYGVSAFFAMSVSTLESGHGTSYLAKTGNNYYGITSISRTYDGLWDCTYYFGDFITRLYINEGRTSVERIAPKYCPDNTWNWTSYVQNHMTELYNKVISTHE